MPDVEVTCAACKGARFNSETLEVALRGTTIDDILKRLTCDERVRQEPPVLTLTIVGIMMSQ